MLSRSKNWSDAGVFQKTSVDWIRPFVSMGAQDLHVPEDVLDALPGTGFLCQLRHAARNRPLGLLSNLSSVLFSLHTGIPGSGWSENSTKCSFFRE